MRDIRVLYFAIDLVVEDPRGTIIEVNTSNITLTNGRSIEKMNEVF